MNEECHWSLIEETRAKAGGSDERHAKLLERKLAKLPIEAIVDFGHWYLEKMEAANRATVLYAVEWIYLVHELGQPSGDGWEYFRSWLVARGQKDFDAVLRNADVLADMFTDIEEFLGGEAVQCAAGHAYQRVTGEEELPQELYEPSSLERWPGHHPIQSLSRADAKLQFPRLHAKFGERPET